MTDQLREMSTRAEIRSPWFESVHAPIEPDEDEGY
jgi:hypothetical protein